MNGSKWSKRRQLADLTKEVKFAINSKQSNTSSVELNSDEVVSFITEAKLTKLVLPSFPDFGIEDGGLFLMLYGS